jgi:hypothetical protein
LYSNNTITNLSFVFQQYHLSLFGWWMMIYFTPYLRASPVAAVKWSVCQKNKLWSQCCNGIKMGIILVNIRRIPWVSKDLWKENDYLTRLVGHSNLATYWPLVIGPCVMFECSIRVYLSSNVYCVWMRKAILPHVQCINADAVTTTFLSNPRPMQWVGSE